MDVASGGAGTVIARSGSEQDAGRLFAAAEPDFARYELVKDLVDECIDLSLNYRQSGHPGGSRSKVHMMLALLLSGAMRWDLLHPWRRFGDRFVLSAGHTVPLVYATLAVLNEAVRTRYERTGSAEFAFPDDGRWALTWEWLLRLRRRGGLPGHAEMEGRTLFLKFNTGPSGHGMPPAAGEALGLKLAGAGEVKVFVVEGEGGLTPGSAHETKNTAWGLGLDNLVFLLDWNDFGIDPRPASSVVAGTPVELVRALRLAGQRHRARHAVGAGHPGGPGGGLRPQPRSRAEHGLVRHPQGPRLRQGRRRQPRHAIPDERRAVLGGPQGVHGQARRHLPGRRRARPGRSGGGRGPGGSEPAHRHERAAPRRRPGDLAVRPAAGDRVHGAGRREELPPRRPGRRRLRRTPPVRRDQLPGQHVEEAGREGGQPGRPGPVGIVRERACPARLRPPGVHRGLRRPGRVHQHRGVRCRLRRHAGRRLVRAGAEPHRGAAAHRDHRVHQRRDDGGTGHRQPGR